MCRAAVEVLMGLAERRAIKAFEDTHWARLLAEIQAAAGSAIPIVVDWVSLASPDQAHLYESSLTDVYFTPIIEAFKRIAFDAMGKEALAAGVKSIVVQNKKPDYSSYWASFENGVLTLDHQLANVDYHKDRADEIVRVLEPKL
jgi:hypothetical protein